MTYKVYLQEYILQKSWDECIKAHVCGKDVQCVSVSSKKKKKWQHMKYDWGVAGQDTCTEACVGYP